MFLWGSCILLDKKSESDQTEILVILPNIFNSFHPPSVYEYQIKIMYSETVLL